jgi:DNA gyrase subunit B/topoisomerase-4 subunit B
VDIGKETYWAQDERDKERILKEKAKGNAKPNIMRFKGLGEMPAADLKATTLDAGRRTALKVSVEDEEETQRVMNELLGKEVSSRFRLIMDSVGEVGELDI